MIFVFDPALQEAYDALRGFTEGYDEGTGPLPIIFPDWILLDIEANTYIVDKAAEALLDMRPDLIAFTSQPLPQIWEIKPFNEENEGKVQLAGYILAINAFLLASAAMTTRPTTTIAFCWGCTA